MNDDDEPLLLNCPQCARRLRFMRIAGNGLPYYVCVMHGWFVIEKDGRLHESQFSPPDLVH